MVHGLVLDRIQKIKSDVVTFGSRCAPVSYGIICDKIYHPEKHIGEAVRHDPRDKMTYAIDQIDWLVIQVSAIPYRSMFRDLSRLERKLTLLSSRAVQSQVLG